jgi:hypothetical protein
MPNLTAFKRIGEQLVHLDSILARPEMRLLPADIRDSWGRERNPYVRRIDRSRYPHFVASYRVLEQITREFHREGVRLLTGTDALNVGVVPGFSIHDELRDLVTAGLTPFEALRAATSNPAAFFSDPRSGTVATGQRADLILLDRNPLTDIGNTRSIVGVMLDGRWIRGDSIRAMLR